MNADGYLVNGSGFYLEGIPIDSTTGDPVGNVATPLNFQSNFLPASATTEVDYAVNLPATPKTTATSSLIPNSNLLNAANFTQNPTLVATANSNAVVTGTAALTTINASGGAITFDVNGQTVTLATNGGSGANGLYTPGDLVNAINTQVGASANVNATLNGAGYLVITSTGRAGRGQLGDGQHLQQRRRNPARLCQRDSDSQRYQRSSGNRSGDRFRCTSLCQRNDRWRLAHRL